MKGDRDVMEALVKPPSEGGFQLSDGEIHYLWWFIQGSIMSPHVRQGLRKAWGSCERHAWGAVSVEASFRHGYMHGPAVLYEDLMGRALAAFEVQGPGKLWRVGRNLREKGRCPMCEMGYGPDSRGTARPEVVERGRDLSALRAFAGHTMPYWRTTICGKCAGNGSPARCRRHLLEDTSRSLIRDVSVQRLLVEDIVHHLEKFHRSFVWGFHGTQTDEDTAALITAVGWCSGWGLLLQIMESSCAVLVPPFGCQ